MNNLESGMRANVHTVVSATVNTSVNASGGAPLVKRGRGRPRLARLRCCRDNGLCLHAIRWMIDGKPYCMRHFEDFWESGEFVDQHRVTRYFEGED